MRTFSEYINESNEKEFKLFESSIHEELTPEQEAKINEALEKFMEKYEEGYTRWFNWICSG